MRQCFDPSIHSPSPMDGAWCIRDKEFFISVPSSCHIMGELRLFLYSWCYTVDLLGGEVTSIAQEEMFNLKGENAFRQAPNPLTETVYYMASLLNYEVQGACSYYWLAYACHLALLLKLALNCLLCCLSCPDRPHSLPPSLTLSCVLVISGFSSSLSLPWMKVSSP